MGKKPKIKKDKKTTIIFFRHGQPDNPKKLIKGVAPFKLSSLGKKQVQKQAKKLKTIPVGMIFTSPVLRCQQTAAIIATQLSLPMCQDDSSGVSRHASFKNHKVTQRKSNPHIGNETTVKHEVFDRSDVNWVKHRLPAQGLKIKTITYLTEWTGVLDGKPEKECKKMPIKEYIAAFKPKEKVLKRMIHFVKMALEKYHGQTIIAVSHQGPIDLLLASLKGKSTKDMPYKDLTTPMAGINKAKFSYQGSLISLEKIVI